MMSIVAKILQSPLIGLFVIAGAVWLVVERTQFLSSALTAEGEVIELIETTDRDMERVLLPKVSYRDADGQEHTFVSSDDGFFLGYHAGQRVEVFYSADGADERINSFASLWAVPMIIGFMGVLLTGFGFFLMRSSGQPFEAESER